MLFMFFCIYFKVGFFFSISLLRISTVSSLYILEDKYDKWHKPKVTC